MNTLLLTLGIWRAVLNIHGNELPFNFELQKKDGSYIIYIQNGLEKIEVHEITFRNDSLIIRLPVYDSEIHAAIKENRMAGVWYNYSRTDQNEIAFYAESGNINRFNTAAAPKTDFTGRYACYFRQNEKDSSLAIGLFEQSGKKVNATFMTNAGDYRFLEGVSDGDSLKLSYFDGAFAYLFLAKMSEKKIDGKFYSGIHYQTAWNGLRNDTVQLPNPYEISKFKEGVTTLSFRFPDKDSNLISFPSEKFKNKVTIVQVSGSWCPNCVDETKYLSWFKENNKHLPVEVIGLMFEKTDDFSKAINNISRFGSFTGAKYPLLFAGNRKNIYTIIPQFEKIGGYPTTIILDKKGNIHKVHTGFNGPATGIHFVKQKEEFEKMIFRLLED
ncbi:MAG: TlpA family protein disulfide reductase [Bacteroidia bacterium]|nr:TlpA family protein disulfide reductase [Bacteroidia bacterium]